MLTFMEIEVKTGISNSHLVNIIAGRRRMSWRLAERLLGLTGIPASWWMRADGKEIEQTLRDPATWEYVETKAS